MRFLTSVFDPRTLGPEHVLPSRWCRWWVSFRITQYRTDRRTDRRPKPLTRPMLVGLRFPLHSTNVIRHNGCNNSTLGMEFHSTCLHHDW